MSYKVSNFMTAVNAALNYPAITYDDVAVYLDMAVSEINTTLHTSLRSIRECVEYETRLAVANNDVAYLAVEPSGSDAELAIADGSEPLTASSWFYYVGTGAMRRKFVHTDANGDVDQVQDRLFGRYVDDGVPKLYEAYPYSDGLCVWVASNGASDVDLSAYLTEDWIVLFLVPYVCFKYTVRDGGVASTFAEEMEQGFQQLQDSYDVPSHVILSRVAGMPAYRGDVEERLARSESLDAPCGTRAITDGMRHSRAIGAKYGSMYDAGGWGL